MSTFLIEAMQPSDWPAVRSIYLEGIATGLATFETEAPSWKDWDASHHHFGRLVAREADRVVGWAGLSPVSRRASHFSHRRKKADAMTKSTKLFLLGISGIVVLIIAVLIGGVLFLRFSAAGQRMSESLDAAEAQGTEFGKTSDQRGCIQEGLARSKKITDITSQVGNRDFVRGCLRSSQASPGFCDDVPSIVGKMFTDWETKQCKTIGSPTVACQDVMKEVILFCGLKRGK